jgi:eukaryotic-like serine/threonine-protein kinase
MSSRNLFRAGCPAVDGGAGDWAIIRSDAISMSCDPARAEAVFNAALARPSAERGLYLDSACRDDPVLRARVEALLRADDGLGGFLDPPTRPDALGEALSPEGDGVSGEGLGSRIGRYKLRRLIGEGGFGSVFMAEQEQPVKRPVAVKVIKPGMDTRQVIARFEAERQALALMDHPNIAKVFDAGATESGRPYVVMELVNGLPITDYCDANHLGTRERLDLFVLVCNAVQHAHTKGVIHRDLKPTNVLVTLADGVPTPKVIDFGIAKATEARLTEKTLLTEDRQFLGTPEYMSPEQAAMSGLDVDTRSDVYSLGVLLYELLTGTTPFDPRDLRKKAYGEIQRIIREVDPPRPSTRLSTLGEALGAVAARRGTDPAKLGRLIRGDLDRVVMRCLEKDRDRRYETADGLARDIGRYLRDEPVEASPPGAGYRLRKFVRRNRGRVAAGGLVLAALLAGMAGTTWGVIRAEKARSAEAQRAEGERRAKEEAQRRLAQVGRATEVLAGVFRNLDPQAAGNTASSLRDLLCGRLSEAAEQLEREPVGDPLAVARLQHLLGTSLRQLGELEQAEAVLVKAMGTRERLLGAEHLDTIAAAHDLAVVYRSRGNLAKAEALHRRALAVRNAHLGSDHPDTLTTRHNLAEVYHSQRRYDAAEALLKEVVAARTAALGAYDPDTTMSQQRLAYLYRSQGRYALAEALFKEVLAARTATLGPNHVDTIATRHGLATVYSAQENYAAARPLYEEVLAVRAAKIGHDHLDTLTTRHGLASLHIALRQYALAEPMLKAVVAARTAKLGADHDDTLRAKYDLAWLYEEQGKHALAEPLLLSVYDRRRRAVTENPSESHAKDLEIAIDRLIRLYDRWGKSGESAKWRKERDALPAANPSR